MRQWSEILCLFLIVSVVLAPLGRVHAHVTGDEHTHVSIHGGHDHTAVQGHGHSHDHGGLAADDNQQNSGEYVVEMQPDLTQRNSNARDELQWLALVLVVAFLLFESRTIRLKPVRRRRTRPRSLYPHALPLLRGPPRFI